MKKITLPLVVQVIKEVCIITTLVAVPIILIVGGWMLVYTQTR